MIHVVNYRGCQIHSAAPFVKARLSFVFFGDGGFADTADEMGSGSVRFMARGEEGYVEPGPVGTGITVTDVSDDGQTIVTRTADGSTVVAGDGKYTVNLGDPDGASRGVQLGNGNTQFNQF
jgi:hypothetical protein